MNPAGDVAIIAFAHTRHTDSTPGTTNGVEMLAPTFAECFRQTGLSRKDIDFWCSGSSDYLAGRAFSFISAIDSIGATPSISESHVEMDAAWALYEAWLKILSGAAETALVYGFGKSSAGNLDAILALQLDPYTVAPLSPSRNELAALQARFGLDSGAWTETDMAEVAARAHGLDISEVLRADFLSDPLRAWDCPPVTDGAASIILARADVARELCERPAFISGMAHSIDSAEFGGRDLTDSPSLRTAANRATRSSTATPDFDGLEVAELHTQYSHHELIAQRALSLPESIAVTPSGGAQVANPLFSAGLERIGYAANCIFEGRAEKALGHASSGHFMQQNLVCVLTGEQ